MLLSCEANEIPLHTVEIVLHSGGWQFDIADNLLCGYITFKKFLSFVKSEQSLSFMYDKSHIHTVTFVYIRKMTWRVIKQSGRVQ